MVAFYLIIVSVEDRFYTLFSMAYIHFDEAKRSEVSGIKADVT